MSTLKSQGGPLIELVACCRDCKVKHHSRPAPGEDFLRELSEWEMKHPRHRVEFFTPHRLIPRDLDDSAFEAAGRAPWWLEVAGYKDNANIKLFYVASAALTITLASLASDTNLLAGRQSTAVDNTSNLYLDHSLCAQVTTGTTPTTAKEIDLYAYGQMDDSGTYPDQITGTDGNVTMTTANILAQGLAQVQVVSTSGTSNEKNTFRPTSVSGLFNGILPNKWGVFVVHNTAVALNATGSNHYVNQRGAYATSI